ncbi:YozE family protein [Parasediminibacterium paludis]|uniref:YozE family protein n=1 Tax=Parasediminibacterium paludis TaxID=908966 RepID=A0ABV8PXL0_9BACT
MSLELAIQNLKNDSTPLGELCEKILLDANFPRNDDDETILNYLLDYKNRFPEVAHLIDELI